MKYEFFTPVATYRIQFNKDFTFSDLEAQLDYLQQLGVSTIYASPIFEAAPGSMHGYDVTNPHQVNPVIGTLEQLRELHTQLSARGMSWIQDIVPDHMALHSHNSRLMDALERGPASPFYNYFDIDWHHPDPSLKGKLMLPFLDKPLPEALGAGEIQLTCHKDGLGITVNGQTFPLSVQGYSFLLSVLPPGQEEWLEAMYKNILQKRSLPEWLQLKQSLLPAGTGVLQAVCTAVNKGNLLTALLDQQYYIFTYWREAEHRINYRRFFTANELITLRMEDKAVFDEYHIFLHKLYQEGIIQGLRIDHIDGLQDPAQYINRLREMFGNNCYIIAEKILAGHESLPERWAVQGSTGYEFLAGVNQLLTDEEGIEKLGRFYRTHFPELSRYPQLARSKKQLILETQMNGEWDNLLREVFRLKMVPPDTNKQKLKVALGAFMVSLPVYRIYPDSWPLSPEEVALLDQAIETAALRNAAVTTELELVKDWWDEDKKALQASAALALLKRIMQFTGPLTAKGVEDTVFYVYNALLSHNEVGDSPAENKCTLTGFHERMATRQYLSPFSLNATATHDTKRGEDARIRLNALTIFPDLWIQQVQAWHLVNKELVTMVADKPAPDLNDEYFIYQSILAGLPANGIVDEAMLERSAAYFLKAVREAKVHSSWSVPDAAYEQACLVFIKRILEKDSAFSVSMQDLLKKLDVHAHTFSLAQVLIKITAPGVPDIYQGCELWDYSFVDPDNRRPVDYALRSKLLQAIAEQDKKGPVLLLKEMAATPFSGKEKLYTTWKALQVRNKHSSLFIHGEYIPLQEIENNGLIAYVRKYRQDWCLVATLLLSAAHTVTKKETRMLTLPANAPQKWKNVFTGEVLTASNGQLLLSSLDDFPVVLLIKG